MSELEDLQAKHDLLQKQHAGAMRSVGNIQVQLDEALQKNVDATQKNADDKAAHERELADLRADHANQLVQLKSGHESRMLAVTDDLNKKYAAHVAELKEKVLKPALLEQHARKQAELKAQQDAELAAL